jgi:hypothetical protein
MSINRLQLVDSEPFADCEYERVDVGQGDVGVRAQELDGPTLVAFNRLLDQHATVLGPSQNGHRSQRLPASGDACSYQSVGLAHDLPGGDQGAALIGASPDASHGRVMVYIPGVEQPDERTCVQDDCSHGYPRGPVPYRV